VELVTKGSKLSKHTLVTREEALRARDLIRERLGSDRVLKITSVALTKAQGEGEFVGYAATFDQEPDAQADVIAPGAFTQSIEDWKAREAWPPLLWNHDFQTPASVLGVVTNMREDDRGLLVNGRLDLDHEPAVAVWKGMKSGRITTFSFAFLVIEE
jgi:HK97 family phage prohead protease